MVECTTEDLVCLYLRSVEDGDQSTPEDAATPGILAALDVGEGAVTGHFEVISALSDLAERGYVASRTAHVEGADGKRTLYELTEEGHERAGELAGRLSDRTVTVETADGRETTTLSAAADRVDEPLATVVARLREDVLVLDEAEADLDAGGRAFVDRETEMDQLQEWLDADDPTVALLDGEPGVGKTRLAEAFGERVEADGGTALEGRCTEGASAPYEPFFDVLAGLPAAERERVTEPLTGGDGARPDDPNDLQQQRRTLFDDVADRLTAVVEEPLVVTLDDVQWIDRPTALLFAHVAAALSREGVLVVATVSPRTPDPSATLSDALSSYDLDAEWLTLAPFDREATTALVHRLVGTRRTPASFVDRLQSATGGNPLFVAESVSRLLETEQVRPEADVYPPVEEPLPVPDTVEDVVTDRLATLDDATRALLERAAVVRGVVPDRILVATSDRPEPAVRDRIDLLVDTRLWTEAEDGVRFVSDVVERTVRDAMADERRRSLHRQLAAAYAESGDHRDEHAAAYHYERAEMIPEALDASLAAADDATDVYAYEVAVEAAERAADLAREVGDDDALLEALTVLGDVRTIVGDYEAARRALEYVAANAGDPDAARTVARPAGTVVDASLSSAREQYERSLKHAERAGEDRRIAASRFGLGAVARAAGDADVARDHLDAAVSAFRAADDPEGAGRALGELGRLAHAEGDHERARSVLTEAVETLSATGDDLERARCRGALGAAMLSDGDVEAGRDHRETALEAADGTWVAVEVLALHAGAELAAGDPGRARSLCERAWVGLARDDAASAPARDRLAALSARLDDKT